MSNLLEHMHTLNATAAKDLTYTVYKGLVFNNDPVSQVDNDNGRHVVKVLECFKDSVIQLDVEKDISDDIRYIFVHRDGSLTLIDVKGDLIGIPQDYWTLDSIPVTIHTWSVTYTQN